MTRTTVLLIGLPVLAAGLVASGCGVANAAPEKRFVIVLLDETNSFVPYWQESLDYAAAIVNRLGPDDAFTLIGIDDHGFDPEDARVEITAIDPSPLRAIPQKRNMAASVRKLERRKLKSNYTDVLGAIRQAALFSNSQKGYRPVLAFFSDMDQTPKAPAPADVVGIKFPAGAEAHCFYVNASGWIEKTASTGGKSWGGVVKLWTSVFAQTGVRSGAEDYYQRGQTRAAVNRIFPAQ